MDPNGRSVRPSFKRVRINSLYFTKTEVSNLLPFSFDRVTVLVFLQVRGLFVLRLHICL